MGKGKSRQWAGKDEIEDDFDNGLRSLTLIIKKGGPRHFQSGKNKEWVSLGYISIEVKKKKILLSTPKCFGLSSVWK